MSRCKICRNSFTARFKFQKTCEEPACMLQYMHRISKKEEQKQMREMKSRAKRISEWRRDLRIIFNRYIRMRDKDLPCISCGIPLEGKYDAGHYYSRGAFPNLAYHPDNCHGQCVRCNQYLHGNLIEYTANLPLRIGEDKFRALQEEKNKRMSLSIPEIQELILKYKDLTKKLS